MNIGHITAILGVDASKFEAGLAKAEKKMNAMSKKMAKVGGIMSLAVTAPLMLIGRKMAMAWDDAIQAETKLNAVIKSTGGIAGKTTDELVDMSAQLQKKTTFGDDVIQGAQGLLLTFTEVRGEIYDQAIPAILDMSTMLGQDLQSSALLVGKALNDPIKGMTNLRRVGVAFTEEQIAKTKELVAAGKVQEAQQMILNELQVEFGGQAEAAATKGLGPMKQMQNNLGDLMEQFGKIIVEGLTPFFNWLSKLVLKFQTMSESTKKWIVGIAAVVAAIGPLLLGLAGLMKGVTVVIGAFKTLATVQKSLTASMATNPYMLMVGALAILATTTFTNVRAATELNRIQRIATDTIATYNQQLEDEQKGLNTAYEALKKTEAGTIDRKVAVDKIQAMYGKYLGNIDLEKASYDQLTLAQKQSNAMLREKITLAVKDNATSKITTRMTELAVEEYELLNKIRKNQEAWNYTPGNAVEQMLNSRLARIRENRAALETELNKVISYFEGLVPTLPVEEFATEKERMEFIAKELGISMEQLAKNVQRDSKWIEKNYHPKPKKQGGLGEDDYTTPPPPPKDMWDDWKKEAWDMAQYQEALLDDQGKYYADYLQSGKQNDVSYYTWKKQQAKDIEKQITDSYLNAAEVRRESDWENLQQQIAVGEAGEEAYEEYLDNRAAADESYYAYVARLQKEQADAADPPPPPPKDAMSYNFGGDITNAITSIPDSILTAIESMKELRASYSTTMADLNEQWRSGALSYQEYVDKMKQATASFEADSKKIGFGKTLINSLAELLITVGKSVMAIGLATDAMKQAFDKPYVAIAAGAAAITTGMILKAVFQGLATGGTVTKSGAFLVGENGPELVNLKAGAAVTPNHMIGTVNQGAETLVTRISGRDLEIILQRASSQTINRRSRG